jgi:hypothetical protein
MRTAISSDSRGRWPLPESLKARWTNRKAPRGEFGEFLCSLAFAARVGDWFFSHAGDSGGRKIEDLAIDL